MKTKVIIISMVVFLLSVMGAIAQQKSSTNTNTGIVSDNKGANYVDKNNDGICDNRTTAKSTKNFSGRNFIDKNNDGICDNRQGSNKTQTAKGRNFVDKNNDGICDNRQGKNSGKCCGKGYCHGNGKGNGNGNQHRHGWRNGNQ
jgi:hypothetical protein